MMDAAAFRRALNRFLNEIPAPTREQWRRGTRFQAGSPPTVFVEPSCLLLLRSHYWARLRTFFGIGVRMVATTAQ